MFQVFETGKVDNLDEFTTHDYLNHESVDDARSNARGPDEVRETVKWLREAFSDLTFEEQEVLEQNDRVAVWVTMRGKHTGTFFGVPPAGIGFAQKQAHFFRCKNGKVAEHRAIRDDLGLRLRLTKGR